MKNRNIIRIIVGIVWIIIVAIGLLAAVPAITGLILLSSIFLGTIFCGWLCPFGFLQDLMPSLGRKLSLPKLKIPKWLDKYLKLLRYVLLLILLLPFASLTLSLFSYDPRSGFQTFISNQTLLLSSSISILVFMVLSLFTDRFFCKYLCTEGAKYSLLSVSRITAIKRTEHCINCGKCAKSCPMQVNLMKSNCVNDIACTNCMTCIESCPVQDAITCTKNFSFKRLGALLLIIIILFGGGYWIKNQNSNSLAVDMPSNLPQDSTGANTETLTGSATGYRGTITVEISKEDDLITDIVVLDHNDDTPWFNQAISVIDNILETQNTEVDTVSGATYSSQGIINAVKDALGESFSEQDVTNSHRRH